MISKSGLTGLIDRMQRAGLVERGGDPRDRRVIDVALTAAGAEAYRNARGDHRRAVADGFLRHLDAGEAAVLERALRRVLGAATSA